MRRALVVLALFVLVPGVCDADVVFEAVGSAEVPANATSLNVPITLGGASSTRAVVVGVACATSLSGMAATIGGEAMSVISGTTSTATIMLGKATSLTGAQTVALSWTTSQVCIAGAISATGVDQTTPFENGTFSNPANSPSLEVTSTSGDLTTTIAVDFFAQPVSDQTGKWAQDAFGTFAGGDIGPGTGTTTHGWTNTPGRISGVNFNAAPETGGAGSVIGGRCCGGFIR